MDYRKTLDDFTKLLDELIHDNIKIPIIVEGIHDKKALKKLGVTGTIIPLNKGLAITNFCDQLAQHYTHVILLTDWDRKGGHLLRILRKNLEGRIQINLDYRKAFAQLSLPRTIEGLPSWLIFLKTKVHAKKT